MPNDEKDTQAMNCKIQQKKKIKIKIIDWSKKQSKKKIKEENFKNEKGGKAREILAYTDCFLHWCSRLKKVFVFSF